MKLLLRILLISIGLGLASVILLVLLVFTLDPNRLKPLLEKQAAERGIQLHEPVAGARIPAGGADVLRGVDGGPETSRRPEVRSDPHAT